MIDDFLNAWDDLDYPDRRKVSEKVATHTNNGASPELIEFGLDEMLIERDAQASGKSE